MCLREFGVATTSHNVLPVLRRVLRPSLSLAGERSMHNATSVCRSASFTVRTPSPLPTYTILTAALCAQLSRCACSWVASSSRNPTSCGRQRRTDSAPCGRQQQMRFSRALPANRWTPPIRRSSSSAKHVSSAAWLCALKTAKLTVRSQRTARKVSNQAASPGACAQQVTCLLAEEAHCCLV
jgi:hypothetical protein